MAARSAVNGIDTKEAASLLQCSVREAYELFSRANAARIENKGLKVNLCGIVNAKSGMCGEDCKFCSQSSSSKAEIDRYPMISAQKMVDAAQSSQSNGAARFGIVTSGVALKKDKDLVAVSTAIEKIASASKIKPCASLGNVDQEVLSRLKEAGLTRYHCNLETAQSFYPQICTTRPWSDSVETVRAAKELGLAVCSGGLFGLGESLVQRVELLEAVRELDVDSVPLNFFNPAPGTALQNVTRISALECLRVVAVTRLMMPDKEIRVCGGREANLRDLQSWVLLSGADGLMVGDYLTTGGREVAKDLEMIEDAGFQVSTTAGQG